jgi:hypothetical protein
MDNFFKILASSLEVSLVKSENWPKIQKGSVRGEKKTSHAGKRIFYSAKPEFYMHLDKFN